MMTTLARPILLLTVAAIMFAPAASAITRLRNICRVKGQEENVLHGYGLVIGLNGTGATNDGPTMRAMARALEALGSPVSSTGRFDAASLQQLKSMKNAALVIVSARVPATGARRGEKLDCSVAAPNGKSLVGGQLAFATLLGPNVKDRSVYALANGPVLVDDLATPTVGRVHAGCQMEQDVYTPFHNAEEGFITLVLDRNHASFHTAASIASKINSQWAQYIQSTDPSVGRVTQQANESWGRANRTADSTYGGPVTSATLVAEARDATSIRVYIPERYREIPVEFTAEILDTLVTEEDPEARVVIHPLTGSIVISGDVRIGDVVVVHNNTVIEAGGTAGFTALHDDQTINPSLQALVNQLEQLKVPPHDVAEIIRAIERDGKLHGKLIIE